jgi:hypothetical protein
MEARSSAYEDDRTSGGLPVLTAATVPRHYVRDRVRDHSGDSPSSLALARKEAGTKIQPPGSAIGLTILVMHDDIKN